jgi:hypothetical protein
MESFRQAVELYDPMPRIGVMKALNARQAKPLVCCSVDEFFVQPMTTVVTTPNPPPHQPTRNCASRYNDRPEMPSRCPCRAPIQSECPDVDGCEADGCHRSPTAESIRITLRGMSGNSDQQSGVFQSDLRSVRYFCRLSRESESAIKFSSLGLDTREPDQSIARSQKGCRCQSQGRTAHERQKLLQRYGPAVRAAC